MPVLKVQLNHPGNQKPFKIGNGYQKINDLIIREWNDESQHYRKFIRNSGEYLSLLNGQPHKGKLLFWGEWEGNSVFTPIINGKNNPNGIHEPFHSIVIRGCENTDPYVYGDYFKYAICSQSGVMCNLLDNSLILFGTTKDIGFELDTVFVVKTHESAQNVFNNNAVNYSQIYREETLEKLEEAYLGPNPSIQNRVYHSQTWWDNSDYFSFVPCKLDNNCGFKKVVLPIPPMAKQKIGHPYHQFDNLNQLGLWKFVVNEVLKQGFYLGIRFAEPKIDNSILNGFSHKQSGTKAKCIKSSDDISVRHKSC